MIVIAIDGPSGAGKSSTSREIARRAGWNYLDTGALYRAVTWLALSLESQDAKEIIQGLKTSPIRFVANPQDPKVFCGDVDITEEIRTSRITDAVSAISANPAIRKELLDLQHKIIEKADRGIVVEGRDIGTVVAPKAPMKIFLTADLEARATRRDAELADSSGVAAVGQSLSNRDHVDSTRAVSPLTPAEDAVIIDSTLLDLDETVDRIWELLKERNLLGCLLLQSSDVLMLVNQLLSIDFLEDAKRLLKIRQELLATEFSMNVNGTIVDLSSWIPGDGNPSLMESPCKSQQVLRWPCRRPMFFVS